MYFLICIAINFTLLQTYFYSAKQDLQYSTYPEDMNDYYTKTLYHSLLFLEEWLGLSLIQANSKKLITTAFFTDFQNQSLYQNMFHIYDQLNQFEVYFGPE